MAYCLRAAFLSILGKENAKIVTQQMAAVASAMLSAAKTPVTPQNLGSMMASGTSSITFLSSAMKSDIFAWPSAMNVFWQAL